MKHALAPLCAGICVPVAAGLAALLDASITMAVAGSGLGLVFSLMEWGTVKLAERGTFSGSIALGVGGMVLRMAVALGALVAIGVVTSRQETLTAIIAFLGSYTVSFTVRLSQAASGVGGNGAAGGLSRRSDGSAHP